MAPGILVGTSSWADPGFVKEWYPPRMAAGERLPWYAQRFGRGAELELLRGPRPHHRSQVGRGDAGRLRVRREGAPAALAPLGGLDSLPPDLRDQAEADQRGRVRLTPELEQTLARRLVEEIAPLAEAGKLGATSCSSRRRFSPRRHELDELDGAGRGAGAAPRGDRAAQPPLGATRSAATRRSAGSPTTTWRSCASTRRRATTSRSCPPTSTRSPATTSPTCACTAATPTATCTASRWPSGSAGSTATTSSRRSPARAQGLAEQAGEVHVFFNNNRDDDAPTAAQRFRALLGQAPAGEEQLQL